MNPSTVFPSRRPVRFARIAAVAQTCRCLFAAVAAVLVVHSVPAQIPGAPDTETFTPNQPLATVYALLYETDGGTNSTFLAGGNNAYLETSLQPNGVPKGDLVAPTYGSTSRLVFTAAQEAINTSGGPLPKVLLGGLFGQSAIQSYLKMPAQNITRIFSNGTVDASFAVGAGANGFVTSILPQADGKIVVGGLFTTFNTLPRLRIARLNNDGSVDPGFSAVSLIDNDVLALASGITPFASYPGGALRPDGTILVGGTFNHVGGLPITKLARLNADGAVDATFHPVIDERVNAIVVQPSGKIIIGGQFTSVNGQPASRIARLNRDGSLDTTFTTTVSGLPIGESNPVSVYVLNQLSSKGGFKLYIGGNFTQINGATRRYLGLIDPNGAVQSFDPGAVIYDKVQSIAVRPDGRVIIGETLGPKDGKSYRPTLLRFFGGTVRN